MNASMLARSKPRRLRGPALALPLLLAAVTCASRPARIVAVPAQPTVEAIPAAPARDGGAPAPWPHGGPSRPGRASLGEAAPVLLPFTVEPMEGGAGVLLVSQAAGERLAWVRRLDGATGELGAPLRLVDEHPVTAFDEPDGRLVLVTSDGEHVCLAAYPRAPGQVATEPHATGGPDLERPTVPAARGCAVMAPAAVVPVGDRVALVELALERPAPSRPAVRAVPRARSGPGDKGKPGSARGAGKAKPHPVGRAATVASARTHAEVRLRWASAEGVFEETAQPTGLRFDPPLEGMTLIDARPRAPGVDLLWYETAAPGKRGPGLGNASIFAGSLRADGSYDPASRVGVFENACEYGHLKDHTHPLLVTAEAGSTYLDVNHDGRCEALRVLPSRGGLAEVRAACALRPERLAGPEPLASDELGGLERVLEQVPRRVAGQAAGDFGLAAWAGGRAWFLRSGAELRSARPGEPTSRAEPPPFAARRSRLAWGAFGADGEGVAWVDGRLARVGPGREVERAEPPQGARLAPLAGPERPADRRRVARIGASWWLARGDVLPVLAPEAASAPPALRGLALPEASALVGGAERGLFLDLASGVLRVRALEATGQLGAGRRFVSPVRAGFDACERRAGGALVAGVSAADPGLTVAFAIDANGSPGVPIATPLPIRAGALALRLVALPGGGAILSDVDRREVVWLDDDGRSLGQAPWPLEESEAVCLDGRPARVSVPTPSPGQLVRVASLGLPGTCVVGEATWAADGTLRWFGSTVSGLDAFAEVGVLDVPLGPVPGARLDVGNEAGPATPSTGAPDGGPDAPSPPSGGSPPARLTAACPGDMVSIAGRFCVDRFEAALVDADSGEPLSPDYPTTPTLVALVRGEWATGRQRTGDLHARAMPLPPLGSWQEAHTPHPLAVSQLDARPQGYASEPVARGACQAAGKRLCTLTEFVTACRGEGDTAFPYGDTYVDGACNVFRDAHPAAILHGNVSVGHLDPRLNWVRAGGRPLAQRTGQSPACRSRWGADAVYDLVGNLDEWVAPPTDPEAHERPLAPSFVGGFYSRATRSGCEARVATHPPAYFDYSTGIRCCRDAVTQEAE